MDQFKSKELYFKNNKNLFDSTACSKKNRQLRQSARWRSIWNGLDIVTFACVWNVFFAFLQRSLLTINAQKSNNGPNARYNADSSRQKERLKREICINLSRIPRRWYFLNYRLQKWTTVWKTLNDANWPSSQGSTLETTKLKPTNIFKSDRDNSLNNLLEGISLCALI